MPLNSDPELASNQQKGIPSSSAVWQQAVIILSGTVVGFLFMLGLEWGRPVLIPVAMAVLLTFLLNPIVKSLHQWGIPRAISVILAVSAAGVVLTCLGWMVTRQVKMMLDELPRNTARIKAKVREVKQLGSGPTKEHIAQMIEEISQEIRLPPDSSRASQDESKENGAATAESNNGMIVIQAPPMRWLNLPGYLGSAVETAATFALTLVLLIFFLIEREDLRDRVVLLAGRAKLALTSKALEDITDRVSRYIGMVAFINGGFGLVLTTGLFALGVPFALLWGFIAAMLRFIPYIGPWIGALFPITMSLALSDSWGQPIAVFAFVAVVELVTNNVVEPLLFGHTTGVSPTALLVSAACWLYLWGPIGLVLSAPFAVCLVVLGKNIPQLRFLSLLLGDKPALQTDYSFYQRLMLGEYQEASALADSRMKDLPPDNVYDEMMIPVLNYTKRDFQRDYLSSREQSLIFEGMRATLAKIDKSSAPQESTADERQTSNLASNESIAASGKVLHPALILGCPASDEADRLALEMLQRLLSGHRWTLEIASLETLTSELAARIRNSPPAIIFISSVTPGGLAQTRYLCKVLKAASPAIQIAVGRWGQKQIEPGEREELFQVGAVFVASSLVDARNLLNSRFPLLQQSSDATVAHGVEDASRSEELPLHTLKHGSLIN